VRKPAKLPDVVAQSVAEGHTFIIVGGGDGTISSAVRHLAHRDVVLGILPLGTANSFARAIGIPLNVDGAIDVLVDGKVADVDVGRIDERYFANAAAIGMPATIARTVPHDLKRWLGRLAYLGVAVFRLFRHNAFRCTLTHDGTTVSLDALEVRIANGGYQGGVLVAEEASVESHDLLIQIIKGSSNLALAASWLRVVLRRPHSPAQVEILRTADIVIETTPRQHVSIDGEVMCRTPIRACVARQALLMMVPPDRHDIS
jgi:YegS/Rv2252/BmrU family lipid kinase